MIEFTDTLSEEESMESFLQFIVYNSDHNEDTTTGVCRTHVMGLISSQYAKSDTLSTQPIMEQTITCEKMINLENVWGLVKMYEKPNICKFKKTFVEACDPSQLDTSLYDILDMFWSLSSSFNGETFQLAGIHGRHNSRNSTTITDTIPPGYST